MALSTTGYFTTGTQPGSAGTNGNYIPVTGAYATYNGATQYTNGTDFLSFYAGNASGGYWGVMTTPTGGGLTYSATGTPTSFPLTGWGVYPGAASPAPTFAVIVPLSTVGYTASGAGATATNGNYVPCAAPNATYQGATQYTNGTYFLSFNSSISYWGIYFAANNYGGGAAYYYVSGGSTTTFPLTGWSTVSSSDAPAPTFVNMAAAAVAASSISGISIISGIYSITF